MEYLTCMPCATMVCMHGLHAINGRFGSLCQSNDSLSIAPLPVEFFCCKKNFKFRFDFMLFVSQYMEGLII